MLSSLVIQAHADSLAVDRVEWTWDDPVVHLRPDFRANQPYEVNGQLYQVLPTLNEYRETGLALLRTSYDSSSTTVTGERFTDERLLGTHRFLRIPCFVRVVNPINEQEAFVKIIDRGPYTAERHIMALSAATFRKLGLNDLVEAQVSLELISDHQPPLILETDIVWGTAAVEQVMDSVISQLDLRAVVSNHAYENRYRVKIGPVFSIGDALFVQSWVRQQHDLDSSIMED